MTVATPGKAPLTMPDEVPITALALLTLHSPPGVASLRVIDRPIHNSGTGAIGDNGLTVIVTELTQAVGIV